MNKIYAAIFPGQGSQSVGMLQDFSQQFPDIVQQTFAEANSQLDFNLWSIVQDGPAELLNQTAYTQPALLATCVAIWRIWRQQDIAAPQVMAGHSLGEYTALVCSEAMSLADATALVHLRGQLMQQAVREGEGAMAAIIGLPDDVVENLCQQISTPMAIVSAANYNADGQLVVAGHKESVEKLTVAAKEAGAKMAKLLNVSVPSHCGLMKGAAEELHQRLNAVTIQPPQIPVIQNVNAHISNEPDKIRALLAEQLYCPVLWTSTLRQLAEMQVVTLLEFGPNKVLTGLAKRTTPVLPCWPVFDLAGLTSAKAELDAN